MPIDFSKCEFRIKQIEEKYRKKADKIKSMSQEKLQGKIRESLWGSYGISPDFRDATKSELLDYLFKTDVRDPYDKDISVATC